MKGCRNCLHCNICILIQKRNGFRDLMNLFFESGYITETRIDKILDEIAKSCRFYLGLEVLKNEKKER